MRESNNTANVPVGCHGIIEGEEGSVNTRSYETAKPVASSVQTVMFSDTKREESSGIPEYYRNLDSGSSTSTINTKDLQEKDETRKEPDSRRYIGVKADKSNIQSINQEINMISITREHHVFLIKLIS
jgi:hypothetical protein